MADVIRTALDAHQLDSRVTYGRVIVWCIADECAWHCWPAGAALGAAVDGLHAALVAGRAAHRAHQAEAATAAVLDVTERVLDEHRLTVSYTSQVASCTGCDWDDYDDAHGTYGDHSQALVAAALAGEG